MVGTSARRAEINEDFSRELERFEKQSPLSVLDEDAAAFKIRVTAAASEAGNEHEPITLDEDLLLRAYSQLKKVKELKQAATRGTKCEFYFILADKVRNFQGTTLKKLAGAFGSAPGLDCAQGDHF